MDLLPESFLSFWGTRNLKVLVHAFPSRYCLMICGNTPVVGIQEKVFMKGESVAGMMKPVIISKLINNFKRSGSQVHRTIVVLGKEGKTVATSNNSSKIKTIKDYFNLKHEQCLFSNKGQQHLDC